MSNAMLLGIGSLLLVLSGVLTFTVLPIANESIQTYAAGPDGIAGNADDPPASQVTLANIWPLTIIAATVIGGVVLLVTGARGLKAGN